MYHTQQICFFKKNGLIFKDHPNFWHGLHVHVWCSEISRAQDRLTDLLQNVYVNYPQYNELLRMIMATVGRGGEGDVGQRIRDEILVIQVAQHSLICSCSLIWIHISSIEANINLFTNCRETMIVRVE